MTFRDLRDAATIDANALLYCKLDRCYLQHGMRIPFLTFARSLITLQSHATSQDDSLEKILGPPCP